MQSYNGLILIFRHAEQSEPNPQKNPVKDSWIELFHCKDRKIYSKFNLQRNSKPHVTYRKNGKEEETQIQI